MNYDISKIPVELQRGFKRNGVIKNLLDYINCEIENLPKEPLDFIFSIGLDVISKNLEKYGFKEFSDKIRLFKRNHKKCPNCGLIYYCEVMSGKYNCPICTEFNKLKMQEKVRKIKETAELNGSYEGRGAKISASLKNKSQEEKNKIRERMIKTTKERHGENFRSRLSKNMWDKRTPEQRAEIAKKVTNTKLNWTQKQKEHFKNAVQKTWRNKTQEEKNEITRKADETSTKRYGYSKKFGSKEHQKDMKEAFKEKYNADNPAKVPEIRKKRENTMQEKYGTIHALQNPGILTKMKTTIKSKTQEEKSAALKKFKDTNKEKFGVEFQAQRHIKNYENYKDKNFYIENFCEIQKDVYSTDIYSICEYFGISYTQALENLKSFNLNYIPKRHSKTQETKFLDELTNHYNITIQRQHKIENFRVDGFTISPIMENSQTPCKGIVIEFLGDYWHGKPNNSELTYFGESFADLHSKTFARFDKIKSKGYRILYIWESDYAEHGISAVQEY